ncbi:MAG TPA: deoxycytidine triphosphate deaminase [bacterium]|nr:deoxycytidine triphosphate deaminase [bacterium]
MSVLSKPEILEHYKEGNIIIDPFNPRNLSSTSYDVRLGPYFYRQLTLKHTEILNPFCQKTLKKMYANLEEAVFVKELKSHINLFQNLKPSDKVILVAPNETILAHTIEFIGGRNGTKNLPAVTSEMRARSSIGRIGIAVCKCAGWGDVGYVNRWTMEITNFSSSVIPLPVGLRVAQIIFHSTSPVDSNDQYFKKGKYQNEFDLKSIKKKWKPSDMLPRLYEDRDLGKFSDFSEIADRHS